MQPFLMGSEVEYSMSAWSNDHRSAANDCHKLLCDVIRRRHRFIEDAYNSTGIYLENGMRYYLDRCDGSGHNEVSSPECHTPRQIATYEKAGDRMLQAARQAVSSANPQLTFVVTKNNLNHVQPEAATWGQHESYTCRVPFEQAAAQLVPHLVSRLPYAGAGFLSSAANSFGFELSQRARHIRHAVGPETTHDRAVFCTRIRNPHDTSPQGWRRAHLITKDSQRCMFGTYLTFGVTGMLFALINEGHQLGQDLQLANPVRAMHSISLDPWVQSKVTLANRRHVTALDIQEAYLLECERILSRGVPVDWMPEVMHHWRNTLDALRRDPLTLATRLDAYLKLTVFDEQLCRSGMSWKQFRDAQQVLAVLRAEVPELVVRAVLAENAGQLPKSDRPQYEQAQKNQALRTVGLDALRFAARMQAVDLKYHELGGLHDQLAAAHAVEDVVISDDEVDAAFGKPPSGGRAATRGEFIRQLSQQHGWKCNWSFLANGGRDAFIDLQDPFRKEFNHLSYAEAMSDPSRLLRYSHPLLRHHF